MLATKESSIALVNDMFRRAGVGFMLTDGVHYVPDVCGLINAVQMFDEFSESNDPYGEHDFGTIGWHGEKIFWKIDYYDKSLTAWEDPLSVRCSRVLTVMLADEY